MAYLKASGMAKRIGSSINKSVKCYQWLYGGVIWHQLSAWLALAYQLASQAGNSGVWRQYQRWAIYSISKGESGINGGK
jgi:hypothetical protein